MIESLVSAGRLAAYLGLTGALIPVQALALSLGWSLAERLPRRYHKMARRILGFRLVVSGTRSTARPTLFVSNHASYLDIEILGSLIQGSFIAKAEVAGWPLFGLLAKLQRTVFVVRRRSTTGEHRDQIAQRLQAGDNLILFAEGTSSDGNRVLPFKIALFSAAETLVDGKPVTVQPVSVAYTMLDGMPLGRGSRPLFAWYGDMELASHMWRMIGLGLVTVDVRFHAPVSFADFGSRKALAAHCHERVAQGLSDALSGRPMGGGAPTNVEDPPDVEDEDDGQPIDEESSPTVGAMA